MLRRRFPRICCWRVTVRAREQPAARPCRSPAEKNSLRGTRAASRRHPRDALNRRVVVHHRRVVVAPRRADLVFGVREVVLQAQEVLGRLQVGIRLRDGEEAAERGRQDVVRLTSGSRRLRVPECRARLRHLLEDPALVRRIALDRLHEVRDEITALQLHVDVGPSGLRLVPEPDEPVVADDAEDDEERDQPSSTHSQSI